MLGCAASFVGREGTRECRKLSVGVGFLPQDHGLPSPCVLWYTTVGRIELFGFSIAI